MDTAAAIELPQLPKVGDVVDGRFEIIGTLGEGGMGQVFRAHDRTRGTDVALKLLIPRYLGRREREERIFREAELMSRVGKHPHLVSLLDSGRLNPEGWPFVSMELIEGDSLSTLLAFGGALPPLAAARIARQIAGAVQALHHAGIVHRDVTAANVLVPGEEVVLIDLSHAGDLSAPRVPVGEAGRLTQPHEVPGTHHYMSREQVRAEPAEPPMDVYAFGVTLVYMLTGMAPRGFGREAFISMQRQGLIESPRVDVQVHPQVPVALAELTNACTLQDARLRPDIDEIVTRLDEIVATLGLTRTLVPTASVPERLGQHGGDTPSPKHGVSSSAEQPDAEETGPIPRAEPSTLPPVESLEHEALGRDHDGAQRYRLVVIVLAALLVVSLGLALWLWLQLPGAAGSTDEASQPEAIRPSEAEEASTHGGDTPESVSPPRHDPSPPVVDEPEPPSEEDEPELATAQERPEPTAEPEGPRTKRSEKRRRPPCADPTSRVQRALESKAWSEVLELTASGRCWKSADLRWSSRAMALYRQGRYEQCLKAAQRAKGSNSKRMAAMCRNAIDAKGPTP